ncbi:MAG: hypothetical protein GY851_12525 [bacterium]|nr:hypothetical protein [bacterium]
MPESDFDWLFLALGLASLVAITGITVVVCFALSRKVVARLWRPMDSAWSNGLLMVAWTVPGFVIAVAISPWWDPVVFDVADALTEGPVTVTYATEPSPDGELCAHLYGWTPDSCYDFSRHVSIEKSGKGLHHRRSERAINSECPCLAKLSWPTERHLHVTCITSYGGDIESRTFLPKCGVEVTYDVVRDVEREVLATVRSPDKRLAADVSVWKWPGGASTVVSMRRRGSGRPWVFVSWGEQDIGVEWKSPTHLVVDATGCDRDAIEYLHNLDWRGVTFEVITDVAKGVSE